MTTPNTTGASGEIQRWTYRLIGGRGGVQLLDRIEAKYGEAVLYDDHLAALSRARDEARRDALEEAAKVAGSFGFGLRSPDGNMIFRMRESSDMPGVIAKEIRALSPAVKALVEEVAPLIDLIPRDGPKPEAVRVAQAALAAVEKEIGT